MVRKIVIGLSVLVIALVIAGTIVATVLLTRGSGGLPSSVVVGTLQGPVRGYLEKGHYFFLGIPYGTVNSTNRFKDAYTPPTWDEVREPVSGISCPQMASIISEDCLVVNVYIPADRPNESLPVMVDIHGGGFQAGAPMTGTNTLVTRGVIVVTLTYRVGIFGFLCVGTAEIPGNVGLKDQVAALRWVRDNIDRFGGDPNRVTISGPSAGGTSVDLHVLSPISNGLFGQAIIQSGSGLSSWSTYRNGTAFAQRVAIALGSNAESLNEIEAVILNATQSELQVAGLTLTDLERSDFFMPCVETPIAGVESFLLESPYNILINNRQNPTPILAGFNDKEGIFVLPDALSATDFAAIDGYYTDLLPSDLNLGDNFQNVSNHIRQFYFGNRNISIETIYEYVDFRTDILFLWPLFRRIALQKLFDNSNIYLYEFKYDGGLNFLKQSLNFTHLDGASHGDELGYLFDMRGQHDTVTDANDSLMIDIMISLWTNFVKYGDPTPEVTETLPVRWTPVSIASDATNMSYLQLDLPLSMRSGVYPERMNLWHDIYNNYFQDVFVQNRK